MIKNRKHGHIGLATNDVERDAKWYVDVLGFEVIGKFPNGSGSNVYFLKNCDVVYEMYQADPPLSPERSITTALTPPISRPITTTVSNRAIPSPRTGSRSCPPSGKKASAISKSPAPPANSWNSARSCKTDVH